MLTAVDGQSHSALGNAPRRRFLGRAFCAALLGSPHLAPAQQLRVPLADMHSHFGLITRRLADSGLAEDMREQGVALLAWTLVSDARWIRGTPFGIEQFREPQPGELGRYFHARLDLMRNYLATHKLKTVLTVADVDACLAGEAGVVLAAEGADFLEGHIGNLEAAFDKGLRHLQLVHYIRTPVGDFQTVAPVHNGLSETGRRLVEACNARGVLVDLAHCTGPAVDHALEVAKRPTVWSHGWVDGEGGDWRDPYGFLRRRLSIAHARKIAARGGVVGLWALGLSRPGRLWPVGPADTRAYAREIVKLVGMIGAEHVAFGTDIEGVGPNWAVNHYGHLRNVIDHLQEFKVAASVIEHVAWRNYARVLKAALPG
ncbi:MAG: membrane dipeptidase [Burkholderiales bacterium]|nr:membrane dipeptidase [Burkholderiales bacterium]